MNCIGWFILAGSKEFTKGIVNPASPELAQVIAGLIDDVEKAKILGSEALCHLSLLKARQEVESQERDELVFQVSILKNELELLKRKESAMSAELEMMRAHKCKAEQEARSMLSQVKQLQKELERYFLLSRDQSKLLEASSQLQIRSTALLLKVTT